MKNPSRSLFDLEAVVVPRVIRHRPASPAGRRHTRRRPKTPAAPATAYSFDTGSPIRCEHTMPERPVEKLGVAPEPIEPLPVQSQAYDLHVEAFDEPDEDTGISIPWNNEEEEVSRVSLQRAVPSVSLSEYEYEKPRTFAQQMTAVEQDLADLASRVETPAPQPNGTPAPPAGGEEAAPDTPPVSTAYGHAIFDAMAKQMKYATEFRLPAVQLSQTFSALDRQLDAELDQSRAPSPVSPVVSQRAPAPSLQEPTPQLPPTGELLKDLVEISRKPSVESSPLPAMAAAAIDVRHEVQLVPQATGMSCWAAGAAMLVAWRDRISIDPSQIAQAAGYWAQYAAGLHPEDTQMFKVWRLKPETAQTYTVEGFADLLRTHGPLWVASAEPGPHIRVVTGMVGDGTPTGTLVHINDPWAQGMKVFSLPNAGSQYTETYQKFVEKQGTLGHQERALQGIYVAHN
jgi:papain like cysteine protease AvrRpt2